MATKKTSSKAKTPKPAKAASAPKPKAPKKAKAPAAPPPDPKPAPAIGSLAPEFELETDAGTKISLASLRGKPVLLYFYPKDDTPGCTVEACAFRDELAALSAAGAVVLGVSRDSVTSHAKFKAKHSLNFPLLSDPTARTIADYGSWGQKAFMGKKFLGIVRTSVLIDADGKVAKVYPKVKPAEHAKEVLADLAAIKR